MRVKQQDFNIVPAELYELPPCILEHDAVCGLLYEIACVVLSNSGFDNDWVLAP
jgi:hypothetical protein